MYDVGIRKAKRSYFAKSRGGMQQSHWYKPFQHILFSPTNNVYSSIFGNRRQHRNMSPHSLSLPKRVSPLLLLSTPHQRGIQNHPQDWHGYSPQLHPYSSYVWGQTFYEHPASSTEDHPYPRALDREHLDLRN